MISKKAMTKLFFGAILGLTISAGTAHAQNDPVRLGQYGAWDAYEYMENGNKVCYMASRPVARTESLRRGDIYTMIIHRPSENITNEVLLTVGYPLRDGSTVEITIGAEKFDFDTEGEIGFTLNRGDEADLIDAIRAGLQMKIRGVSSRGNATNDTYSLRGSSAALERINEACGI